MSPVVAYHDGARKKKKNRKYPQVQIRVLTSYDAEILASYKNFLRIIKHLLYSKQ